MQLLRRMDAACSFKDNSCESLLLKFQDTVFKARSTNLHCMAVFIDLSKAFDLVRHDILLDKLEFWGLPKQWFAAYLKDRTQYVSIGNANSSTVNVEFGVPQGSCLGPILFSLFLSCLPQCLDIDVLMFADDTTFVAVDKDITALTNKVNEQLKIVEDYFKANYFVLNAKKTRMIFFSNSKNCPKLQLCGQDIIRIHESSKEKSFKFLGVQIDESLTYKYHINWVCKKINASLALLLRSKRALPYKMKLLVYNALIMSHINYGSCIWGGASISELKKLEAPQKKAIRAVCNAKYNQHATPLFYETRTLKIQDCLELNFLKLGNKLLKGKQPNTIIKLFNFTSNERTRSGNYFHLEEPKCSRRLESAASYCLPKTWNLAISNYSINLETKLSTLIETYKETSQRYPPLAGKRKYPVHI